MKDLVTTKTVTHDSLPGASVTVHPATYRASLYRLVLIEQGNKAIGDADRNDPDVLTDTIGTAVIYPSLMASVCDHKGFDHWPLTADEVMEMPTGFVEAWEEATFSLNPQWKAVPPQSEQEKKD